MDPFSTLGSYTGHAIAGGVFIAWGLYVSFCVIQAYLASSSNAACGGAACAARARSGGRAGAASAARRGTGAAAQPFRGRPWYGFAAGPGRLLEPWFKLAVGVLAAATELRFSAACRVPPAWRWDPCWPLYKPDGHFNHEHLNNWQHASMYALLSFSGAVDLIGARTELPRGTEQARATAAAAAQSAAGAHAFLVLGFLSATLLMGLHAKPQQLDNILHLLLMLAMAAATAVSAAEALFPQSFVLAAARPMVLVLVGTWFVQIGRILFMGDPAWSLDDHSGVHMAPIMFVMHIFFICAAFLCLFTALRAARARGGALGRLLRSGYLSPPPAPVRGGGCACGGDSGGCGGRGAREAEGELPEEHALEMGSLLDHHRRQAVQWKAGSAGGGAKPTPLDCLDQDGGSGGENDCDGASPDTRVVVGCVVHADAHVRRHGGPAHG
ncbi:MAG: hypothetical protein J3K34DRAFT_527728 [Monoraphidium minutum]|nr:MAG: hypothetical protein J3K34DRAFT_527728 [Monoraphidium minutum]